MKINDVSKLTGLPISTLRFYERKDLIPDSYVKEMQIIIVFILKTL